MNKTSLEMLFIQAVAADFNVCGAEVQVNKTINTDIDYLKRLDAAKWRIDNVENDEERIFWIGMALTSLKKDKQTNKEKIAKVIKIAFQEDGFFYNEAKPIYVASEILTRVKEELSK